MTACGAVPARNRPRLPRIEALRGSWQLVAAQPYGAAIYRASGCYVKIVPASWGADDLRCSPAREAAQLVWLEACGVSVPPVLDVGADAEWTWLVTRACPGVPVTHAPDPDGAVDAFADLARALHQLPPRECPDPIGVEALIGWARRATANGWVDTEDLDPHNAGRSPEQLLAALEAMRRPCEVEVVTHGDLTPDNVLVDGPGSTVTAVLDVGRLGVTGAWRDLAVARRNLAELAPHLADRFLTRYGALQDPVREAFYLLLDEFL
jgi:kanamycin kinase